MAHAVPRGNPHAAVEDIRRVARGVMRHRISLNFNARAEGITDSSGVRLRLSEL